MTVKELNKKHNWNIPEYCPECGAETQVSSSGDVFCPNENCNKKIEHCFNKFFDVLDIKGGGSVFIDKIVKKGYNILSFTENCKNPSEEFINVLMECAGGINGKKILSATQEKIVPLESSKLLAIFDVDGFDVKKLAVFDDKSIDEILNISYDELINIPGFAEITSNAFLDFVKKYNEKIKLAEGLFGCKTVSKKADGLVFCFTGAGCLPRKELQKMAEANGNKVGSSVSSNTDYVVSDDTDFSSAKMVKAKKLGIKIISSEEFCRMMNNG